MEGRQLAGMVQMWTNFAEGQRLSRQRGVAAQALNEATTEVERLLPPLPPLVSPSGSSVSTLTVDATSSTPGVVSATQPTPNVVPGQKSVEAESYSSLDGVCIGDSTWMSMDHDQRFLVPYLLQTRVLVCVEMG